MPAEQLVETWMGERPLPIGGRERGQIVMSCEGGGLGLESASLESGDDLFLAAHVLVQRRSPDAELVRQSTHGQRGQALALEHLFGNVEDFVAALSHHYLSVGN